MVQIAALEVQNVKRAINRYGTLPKGARIGAYLESLRQSGLSSNDPSSTDTTESQNQDNGPKVSSEDCKLSPRASLKHQHQHQPQMIRSNSSSGVTSTSFNQTPGSPTGVKLQRHRTAPLRSNTTDGGGLRTFRSGKGNIELKLCFWLFLDLLTSQMRCLCFF